MKLLDSKTYVIPPIRPYIDRKYCEPKLPRLKHEDTSLLQITVHPLTSLVSSYTSLLLLEPVG